MTDNHVYTLFESETVRIEDFRCAGIASGEEEYPLAHEIVLIRSGLFVRSDSWGTTVADANQMLFFHRNQPYQIEHPVAGGECSTVFALKSDVLLEIIGEIDASVESRPEKPFITGYAPAATHHSFAHYSLLHSLSSADALEVEENVILFLADVIRCAYAIRGHASLITNMQTARNHREIADTVKLYFGRHFMEKLSLNNIALVVHCSPYFLCRLFKRETGISIHQYLQRIRLLHALESLAEHRQKDLTSLAIELGFSSHSHFSTAFLREFGITPSKFRLQATTCNLNEMSKILKV